MWQAASPKNASSARDAAMYPRKPRRFNVIVSGQQGEMFAPANTSKSSVKLMMGFLADLVQLIPSGDVATPMPQVPLSVSKVSQSNSPVPSVNP